MSNTVNRGTGRGKQAAEHNNVMGIAPPNMANANNTFALPLVPDYRPEFSNIPTHQQAQMPMSQPAYNQGMYNQYDQQRQYFPITPQQQQPQQFARYQEFQPNSYSNSYNGHQEQPHYPPIYYTQQPGQQQQHAPQPIQKREKKILPICDPDTKEAINVKSVEKKAETPAEPKNNANRGIKSSMVEQVKKEIDAKQTLEQSAKPEETTQVHKVEVQPVAVKEEHVVAKKQQPEVTVVAEETAPVPAPDAETAPAPVEALVKHIESLKIEEEKSGEISEDKPAIRGEVSQSEESQESVEKSPEDLAREEAEKVAAEAEKRRNRERELDLKAHKLLATDEVDPEKGVYNRDFMVTIRDIEKEFKRCGCPLTPAELADFGLDINSSKTTDKKPNFAPSWLQQGKNRSNNLYRGRTTTDGTGRGGPRTDRGMHRKNPPTVRGSIERVQKFTLPTSKDAWKPDRQKGAEEIAGEEARVKDICKKVRSLMNKITPTSKEELIKEFIGYDVSSNDDQLTQVVNIIFDKAVEEPKFCALYAEVCHDQVQHELSIHSSKSLFRNKVLTRAQTTFNDKTLEISQEKLDAIENETNPANKNLLKAEILEEQIKFRRRKFGNMTFIGYLFRNQLLSTKIVHSCIFELLNSILSQPDKSKLTKETIDEESVHCALQLIETLGVILDRNVENRHFLDKLFVALEEAKAACTNKIKFMIMNLIELRRNKWVPRKSVETGPKKIDEIHKEIRQEQIENEKQRDMYNRGNRLGSNSLKKQGPIARNSLEKKNYHNPEQRRAAAVANTKMTTSNIAPKQFNLSQLTDQSFGKSKKEWHSGSSGGGTTTTEGSKTTWRGNEQRKKSSVGEKESALSAAREIAAGSVSARRSASQNSIANEIEEVELTKDQQAARAKIMNSVHSDLKEVISEDLSRKDMLDGLFEMVDKDKYGKPTLLAVYEMTIRAATEKGFKPDERVLLSCVLRQSLTDKKKKQAFIDGAIRFVKYVVDSESWEDYPNVWKITGEILKNMYHLPETLQEGTEQLILNDLGPVFLASKTEDEGSKYSLFIDFLTRLVEEELQEAKECPGMAWEFQEFAQREEMLNDGLSAELEKVVTRNGKSLKTLLES